MPFYEYRCEDCGHQLEVLQKISDPLLKTCPACGADALRKLVSASAFVLKGSGWYVTDFRDKDKAKNKGEKAADKSGDKPAAETKSSGDGAAKSDSAGEKSKEKSTGSSSKDTKPAKKAANE